MLLLLMMMWMQLLLLLLQLEATNRVRDLADVWRMTTRLLLLLLSGAAILLLLLLLLQSAREFLVRETGHPCTALVSLPVLQLFQLLLVLFIQGECKQVILLFLRFQGFWSQEVAATAADS